MNTPIPQSLTVRLPVMATLRECAALKQQLLVLLTSPEPVTIDATEVDLIDTAVLQLLFAFGRERVANGLKTIWLGDSPTFREAAVTMGLQVGDSAISANIKASKDVS